jgi:hypothetical protein
LLSGLKPECEDESTMVLQNVKNYLPSDMVSHPRRLASSATPANPKKITNISRQELCDMSRNIFRCEARLEDGSQHWRHFYEIRLVKLHRKNSLQILGRS